MLIEFVSHAVHLAKNVKDQARYAQNVILGWCLLMISVEFAILLVILVAEILIHVEVVRELIH